MERPSQEWGHSESERMLRSFFESFPSFMGILELADAADDFLTIRLNLAARELVGPEGGDRVGKWGRELGAPEATRQLWVSKMRECLVTQESTTFEFSRNFPSGLKYLSTVLSPIGQEESGNWRYSYVATDVTHIVRTKIALRESEKRMLLTQEFCQAGTWEWEPETDELKWAAPMGQVFGIAEDDAPTTSVQFATLIHPLDRARVLADLEASIRTGQDHYCEFRLNLPSGEVRWIEGRGRFMNEAAGQNRRMLGIAINITDRKRAEALLKEQAAKIVGLSKMSALGEMAAGIAHEINNPLTIIRGSATLIKRQLKLPRLNLEVLRTLAKNVEKTSIRIAAIVEGLRLFARDGSGDAFEKSGLNGILHETLRLCGERFRKNGVELRTEEGVAGLEVSCRSVQISQVILNLLNNAHDAAIEMPERWVKVSVGRAGGSEAYIRVQDSGKGIDPGDLDRLFHPFFTTKPPGKGTGLGLSIAQGIVGAHGGTLAYERVDGATCFTVKLPLAEFVETAR